MMTVAVIIPFFQAKQGILVRAIRSVLDQRLEAGVRLRVIVVDDSSPSPAPADLAALPPEDAARIEVIRQPNGGPAAARNRGLEAALDDADFVAFLDSDDYWRPDHLATALAALGDDSDFYFSDIDEGGGRTWFQRSESGRELLARRERGTALVRLTGTEARSLILKEHLAHASGVVYRLASAADLRFRTVLRDAGEDHLFWIELAGAARQVAIGADAKAGRHDDGINMFTGRLDWDDPGMVKILISVLRKYRVLEGAPELAGPDLPLVRERRRRSQDQIAFIVLRGLLKRPASFAPALSRLFDAVAGARLWLLPAAARAVFARATGRFEIVF